MISVIRKIGFAASLVSLAVACTPDTRDLTIQNLQVNRNFDTKWSTFDFDVERPSFDSFHCSAREATDVINLTFFYACDEEGWYFQFPGYNATTPNDFTILLNHDVVCPPSPEVQSWRWRTTNVKDAVTCEDASSGVVQCEQSEASDEITASWV